MRVSMVNFSAQSTRSNSSNKNRAKTSFGMQLTGTLEATIKNLPTKLTPTEYEERIAALTQISSGKIAHIFNQFSSEGIYKHLKDSFSVRIGRVSDAGSRTKDFDASKHTAEEVFEFLEGKDTAQAIPEASPIYAKTNGINERLEELGQESFV